MLLFFFLLESNRLDGLEEQVKPEPAKEVIEKQKKAKTQENQRDRKGRKKSGVEIRRQKIDKREKDDQRQRESKNFRKVQEGYSTCVTAAEESG